MRESSEGLTADAKLLRRSYGENLRVVFIGPWPVKKREADERDELVDRELRDEKGGGSQWSVMDVLFSYPRPSQNSATCGPFQSGIGSRYARMNGQVGWLSNAVLRAGLCNSGYETKRGCQCFRRMVWTS